MKIEVDITDYVEDIVERIKECPDKSDFKLEGDTLEDFKEAMSMWFLESLDGSVKYIPEDLGYC